MSIATGPANGLEVPRSTLIWLGSNVGPRRRRPVACGAVTDAPDRPTPEDACTEEMVELADVLRGLARLEAEILSL